jgi:chromosome segregation ATPase
MSAGALNALEQFKTLEERIAMVLKKVGEIRKEKGKVEKDLADARREIRSLQKEIEGLRKERLLVRGRVESLIETISERSEKQIV